MSKQTLTLTFEFTDTPEGVQCKKIDHDAEHHLLAQRLMIECLMRDLEALGDKGISYAANLVQHDTARTVKSLVENVRGGKPYEVKDLILS